MSQQRRRPGGADEAGLRMADVDALFTAGSCRGPVVSLAEYLGIRPDYLDGTNIGGSSSRRTWAMPRQPSRPG